MHGLQPLTGRRTELAAIGTAIARARDGLPATIALVGEPGIGKTRLASEAAQAATATGFTALWGRAWEAGGAPAYWPWRQLCETLPREPIAPLWGRGGNAADAEQARFELFDAVTRAIAERAGTGPLVCILDDLHAADVPSLELIAFATRHLRSCRVLWLVTWRDAEGSRQPVRDQLSRIAREATVFSLGALSDIDVNQLIDQVRSEADVELRTKLVQATGGNPLFLLETLAALSTGRAVATDLPLAQGIAAIVRDRLGLVSAQTRDAVAAAAVIGRDVALSRWAAAAELPADALRGAARELVDAGILGPAGHDRWRFGHDLVREAIYRSSDPHGLHHRLSVALDREVNAGDVSVVGERAHHGLLALAGTDDPHRAIEWSAVASEQARQQCAYEEAIAIADRAIAMVPAAQRDAHLQLARGRALLDVNDSVRADEAVQAAIRLARGAKDARMFARAVLALGTRYVLGDYPHELIALIDEAAAMLEPTERELQARLLARKAAALTPAADPAPVLEMAREALALVAKSEDLVSRLEVSLAAGSTFASTATARECCANDDETIRLARQVGDRAVELRGLSRLVLHCLQGGDFARADALLVERDALARALIQPRFAWMEPLFRSLRGSLRGDFSHCDADLREARSYAAHDPNCTRACAVHELWLLFAADRVEQLRAHEPILLDSIRTMKPVLATVIRAAIRFREGDLAGARREVDALDEDLAHGRSVGIPAALAEVLVETGPAELQREVYDILAPHSDGFAAFNLFGFVVGPPVAASLGSLAGAMGDLERARAHFDSAITIATRNGAVVGRAWTLYWYGRTLARAGHADAARLLDDAAREAEALGLTGLAARCRSTTGPRPTVAPSQPAVPQAALRWKLTEKAGSWLVEVGDRSVLVPALRGMPMLARLAASPHVEIHSVELVSGGSEAVDGGDAGELLDDKAKSAYRKRLATLADELEDAQDHGDVAKAEEIRDEHEALLKELSRAVGLGNKTRRAGAATERARVSAQRRLREAIKKITEADAELGAHLDATIRTGTFCAYRP